jgi:hypothetical protein
MKKLCKALLCIGFATNTTVAISGDVNKSSNNYVLLDGRALQVEANIIRSQNPSELMTPMNMNANGYMRAQGSSTLMQKSTSFTPSEGIYEESETRFESSCVDLNSPFTQDAVESIVNVDTENNTFTLRTTLVDNPEDDPHDTQCRLFDTFYNCQQDLQTIESDFLEQDAEITIKNTEHGIWTGEKKFVRIIGSLITCEGPDCDEEPASNLFGLLIKEMPCSSRNIVEYKWQSPPPSQSDVHLLLNSVNTENQRNPDTQNLATEAIVDTDDRFEAILFDFQSQETLATLVWDHAQGSGIITFEVDGTHDTISLDISDIENIPASERYTILLQGLHEAGIAWLNYQDGSQNSKSNVQGQPLNVQVNQVTDGIIDTISQNSVSINYSNNDDVTPYAEGWAYNPNDSGKSIWVHLYAKSDSQTKYQYVGAVYANQESADSNKAMNISGHHGFKINVPTQQDTDE